MVRFTAVNTSRWRWLHGENDSNLTPKFHGTEVCLVKSAQEVRFDDKNPREEGNEEEEEGGYLLWQRTRGTQGVVGTGAEHREELRGDGSSAVV